MEEILENNKSKVKYDFSNPESQRLFEEFTFFLSELTERFERSNRERDKSELSLPISNYRSRDLLKEIFARFYNLLVVRWDIVKKQVKNIFNINK